MGILKTETGRIRTGWRILLFLLLLPVFVVGFSIVPFHGLNWEAVPALLAGLVAGWILLRLDGRGPGALGFHLSGASPGEAALGLGLGIGVAAFVVAGMVAFGGILWVGEPGSIRDFLGAGGIAMWFFLLPAAAEEVLFRGYFLQALAESWGAVRALWATSLAFGLIHLANPNTSVVGIGNIVVAGLFLGVVYLKTASLWWATGAHLGWNWFLGFAADLPVSGLELVDSPLYEGVTRGAPWLSGGAFGPEGSVLATLGLGLAAYLVWKSPRFKPGLATINGRPLILSLPELRPAENRMEGSPEPRDSGSEA